MSASSKEKAQVLFLFPGPRWEIRHEFASRIRGFEKRICPWFFASADRKCEIRTKRGGIFAFDYGHKEGLLGKIGYYIRYLRNALRLAKKIRSEAGKLDVIVSYDPLGTGLVGIVIATLFRSKLICEVNGVFDDRILYKGRFNGSVKRMLNMAIERVVLSYCDGVKLLFSSQYDRAKIEGKPILVLFDHVESEHFYVAEGDKIVLGLGAPFFVKGFDLLIRAFSKVNEKHPEWRLIIVGHFEGDEDAIRDLVGRATDVEVRKAVYHRELPPLMASCSILAAPSRSEGMSRVLVEGMHAQKARIGARVGGVPTVIEDGKDGLMCEPESISDLASQLDRLMESSSLRELLARSGHERGKREFTLERFVDDYSEFIYSIL